MLGRGNVCHTEVVDADGHVEPCHQPTVGVITIRDEYGRKDVYPVCEQCKTVVMEGIDDA